jgi:hypothetical protein
MKKELHKQFLPFNYTQTPYKNLHNLRQLNSVDDHTEKFYDLNCRLDLQDIEKQQVARYLSGLKPPIQDALCMYPIWSISEAYNRALIIEKQLTKKAL